VHAGGVIGCALTLVLSAGAAQADIYVYRDAGGTMHFSDYPKHAGFKQDTRLSGPSEAARRRARAWSPDDVRREIHARADRHGLDPVLVEKVVWAESNFNPLAVSQKGAMGLMQLMPATADLLSVAEPFDPVQNLEGGMRYLRYLLDRFSGRLDLALAAYNAGEGRVLRAGGVPAITETRHYVRKIMTAYLEAPRAR
jgi:soluble lytic murein transglycosylase-like protein